MPKRKCLLLALSGHPDVTAQCPLSGVKRTSADLRWLIRSLLMMTVIGSLRPETTGHHHAAL
jgi:hypothetical protein